VLGCAASLPLITGREELVLAARRRVAKRGLRRDLTMPAAIRVCQDTERTGSIRVVAAAR